MSRHLRLLALLLSLPLLLSGVLSVTAQQDGPTPSPSPAPGQNLISPEALSSTPYLVPEVLSVIERDGSSYTQGLLLHEGSLYESAGRTGESRLMEVDPATGEVLREVWLNEQVFAEGLALVEDRLIQLTWTSQIAYFWDLESFQPLGIYLYEGQGWGLCYDGEFLWMSNGSEYLQKRHPNSFRLLEEIPVLLEGQPINNLNELECVGESIYANVYKTDYILEIDPSSGVVNALVDASGLLTEEEWAALDRSAEVLNGIAYDAENDLFYITGKYWTKLFTVRFVEANP